MPNLPDRAAIDRHAAAERIAVIDIGSNSIRLVVYDGLSRVPTAIFNEKVLCGLGKTVERTGKLNPDGVQLALQNLSRFKRLIDGMVVGRTDVLATAAVRDAADGPAFVDEVTRRTGLPVTIVSGEEEARLSAMGVLSGHPGADGLAGDLGGGSLELIVLEQGAVGRYATLPLGPFRLMDHAEGGKLGQALKIIDGNLAKLSWIGRGKGKSFHPVGGSWRALAKMHLEQVKHPLHIIHDYTVPAMEIADFAGLIARQSKSSLEKIPGMSRRRMDVLPLAALVLERVLRTVEPGKVVFSGYGLREGHLFDLLSEEERRRDPLLTACATTAERLGRFGQAEMLIHWTAPLFVGEDDAAARLRQAACLLSDLGWSEHPDYRAEHAFMRILRMPFPGADHVTRAYLALAVWFRYGGAADAPILAGAKSLATGGMLARATILGLALRLAHTLTGGATALLQRTSLRLGDETLALVLPEDAGMLNGETVQRRTDSLAKALNRTGEIVVQQAPRLAV